jgi:ribosomal protein L11 methyltransferase
LGCRKVIACDIDPDAIHTARANGVANQCDREIQWVPGSVPNIKSGSFDVIVANLTAEIILAEIDAIQGRLGSGGNLILSGFLDIQLSRVQQELKGTELGRRRIRRKGEWVCLIARNK